MASPNIWLITFQISTKLVHFRQSYSRLHEGRQNALKVNLILGETIASRRVIKHQESKRLHYLSAQSLSGDVLLRISLYLIFAVFSCLMQPLLSLQFYTANFLQ